MTTETRTYIELQDIIGLDVSCPHCMARISYDLKHFDRFSFVCPNCHEQWFGTAGQYDAADAKAIKEFVGDLTDLWRREQVNRLVRLQIRHQLPIPHGEKG